MKTALFAFVTLAVLAAGGWTLAETTAAKPTPAAVHEAGGCMMGSGMMGGGMMGGGMMGGGMGPMGMMGPGTKIAVKNIDKGVSITLTASDAATAVRLQKMAEAMRLMHEAMSPEK